MKFKNITEMEHELICFCVKLYDCEYFTLFEKNYHWEREVSRRDAFIRDTIDNTYKPNNLFFGKVAEVDSVYKKYGTETALNVLRKSLIEATVAYHDAEIHPLHLINKSNQDLITIYSKLPDSSRAMVINELADCGIKITNGDLIKVYLNENLELNKIKDIYKELIPSQIGPDVFDEFQTRIKAGEAIDEINKELNLGLDKGKIENIKSKYKSVRQ